MQKTERTTPTDGPATTATVQPVTGGAATGRYKTWTGHALWAVASATLGVVLWQALIWAGVLPAQYFPGIIDLGTAWAGLIVDPGFWRAIGLTLYSALAGLFWGILVGVPVGVLVGRNVYLFHALRFPLEFLRPIPTVALIPAIVLVLGTQTEAKVVLVFISVVFPIIVQTTSGARDVDPVAMDTARIYRLGRIRSLFQVLLPAASPYIVTGIRVSSAIALLVSVSTEIIIGAPGLGQEIATAEAGFALDRMYALIAMSGFLGIAINIVVTALEGKATAWSKASDGGK